MKILRKSKTRHIYLVQKVLLQGELSYYIKKDPSTAWVPARDIFYLARTNRSELYNISVHVLNYLIQLDNFVGHNLPGHVHIIEPSANIILDHDFLPPWLNCHS